MLGSVDIQLGPKIRRRLTGSFALGNTDSYVYIPTCYFGCYARYMVTLNS